MQSAQTAQPNSLDDILKFWESLTRPYHSVRDEIARRNARLLSATLLFASLLGILILLYLIVDNPTIADDPDTILSILATGLALVGYLINRFRGGFHLALALVNSITFIAFVIGPFFEGSRTEIIYFSLLPILFTALFYGARRMVMMASAVVITTIVMMSLVPSKAGINLVYAIQFLIIISVLLLVYVNHQRSLEQVRRAELEEANQQLRQSEISLERRVNERTRDLELAAEISRQITTVLDRNELLSNVVEQTRHAYDLSYVSIFIFDTETQALKFELGAPHSHDEKAKGHISELDKPGLITRAARERRVVIVNDVLNEADYVQFLPEIRSEMALPIMIGDHLLGVLDLQADTKAFFDLDDERVLTSLAEQIAIALRNAQLYAEQQAMVEQLRQIDYLKSQFLASMSHELRTPLNAILNFTQFVQMGMLGPVTDQQVDALNKTLDSGNHLLSLINDVLDITKIESGMMKLFVEQDIDLQEDIDAILATAQTMVSDKPVKVVAAIQGDLPQIMGDKRRIRQVLLNLMSNAAKFTEAGEISFRAEVQGDNLLFTIKDTGPGIPEEHQLKIFEPFEQTETGIRHAGGTGLGLPISKRLVEAHGGSLWLTSSDIGSTFFVSLPVHSEALQEMILLPE